MNSPTEMVEVRCPICGGVFAVWQVWSFDESTSTRCPTCSYDLAADPLLRENGPWSLVEDDEEATRQ